MAKQQKAAKKQTNKKGLKGCKKQTSKKYAERPSPPYPATPCHDMQMTGNDGREYVSKPASDGSYRWHPMTTRSKAKKVSKTSSCE